MSVAVKNVEENSYYSYVKGSPEMLKTLCVRESIPHDYDEVMNKYTT
jgi:cation-transporting ATPase 13A2